MPDMEREKKIAAAKRKLRKFKKKRVQDLKTPADDVSSLASEENLDENICGDTLNNHNHNNAESLPQDTYQKHPSHIENELNYSSNISTLESEHVGNNIETQDKAILSKGPFHDEDEHNTNNDSPHVGENGNNHFEESSQQLLDDNSNNVEVHADNSTLQKVTVATADEKIDDFTNTENLIDLNEEPTSNLANLEVTGADETSTNMQVDTTLQNDNHCELQTDEAQLSSATAEKILQISTKLNGLAAEAQSYENGSSFASADTYVLTELENRNQHLAEQVAALTRQKQELMMQMEQVTQQMTELHHRLEAEKQQIYTHGVNEQNTLRQQLQVQMQTISILVAEKQELQHQIHEARSSITQEQNTRQRSQDQLQDLKIKIQTLERELKSSSDSLSHLNAVKIELTEERNLMQVSLQKVTRSNDEISMHANELSQKLSNKENECKRISIELLDLNEKLSMAEVLLQQHSNTSGASAVSQSKQLQEERESLNQKLIEYQQAFKQLTEEREQLSRQYEDVNEQMQKQVTGLSEQVTLLENEKSSLQNKLEEMQSVVKNLQDRSETLGDNDTVAKNQDLEKEYGIQIEQTNRELERVLAERDDVINQMNTQLRNNERLAKLNEEQEFQLSELNRNMSESIASTDEHSRLLEQSQNDKATISRALMQNKQLKQQLEEMQEGFIKLSNDKMELATQLTTTEHLRRELEEDIEKQKLILSLAQEKLSSKEQSVDELENALLQAQVSGHSPESSQQVDSSLMENLQTELQASQQTVNILGEQNTQLKSMVTTLQQKLDETQEAKLPNVVPVSQEAVIVPDDNASSGSFDSDEDEASVALLSTSLQQLEQERDALAERFEEQQQEHAALLDQYQELKENQAQEENVPSESHQQFVDNMALLQERFSKVMKEKVEALSRVEELEHINLQLENECETIGEYITLYHNQRQVLKQRHHEKDEYVSAMAQEREAMQLKLDKLQALVRTLLQNRAEKPPSASPSPLTSSPAKLKVQTIEGQEDDMQPDRSEWPDMLEDDDGKPVWPSRPDLLPDPAMLPPNQDPLVNEEVILKSDPYPGKLERVEDSSTNEESATANEIINLLEQMQHPVRPVTPDIPKGFGLHYMGPYTAI